MELVEKLVNEEVMVSVVIATWNHERYIEKAILSAINQTYKNLQILILDDHSTSKKT